MDQVVIFFFPENLDFGRFFMRFIGGYQGLVENVGAIVSIDLKCPGRSSERKCNKSDRIDCLRMVNFH